MAPPTSIVWNFFKKITPESCSCNLCGKSYKTSGNTTNLITHLKNKHYNAYLKISSRKKCTQTAAKKVLPRTHQKESISSFLGGSSHSHSQPPSPQASSSAHASTSFENVELPEHPSEHPEDKMDDSEQEDDVASQMSTSSMSVSSISFQSPSQPPTKKQQTLADCLERKSSFEDGGQRHADVTQALIYMVCKDNLPFSCVEKDGLRRFSRVACPHYKLPSRFKITQLVEQRYHTMKAIVKKVLEDTKHISLTSDILTITNSTRSFIVMTGHFQTDGILESISFSAKRLFQSHTAEYVMEQFEEITEEFSISKEKILSITTDGGSNMVAAVRLFLGEGKRIPCMAHLLNLVVDGALKDNRTFSNLTDHIKSIVLYFKQSVIAMDELREEQTSSGKKEGEVLTLIQSVSTRWNSCLDMIERFNQLSGIVAKILANRSSSRRKVPDMVAASQLNIVRDLIDLLRPFKQATEDVSGENYVTASLVVPLSNLLRQELEQSNPSTEVGISIKNKLLQEVTNRLVSLEKNSFLAKAAILDPRFKKLHFSSPLHVSNVIMDISEEVRAGHKRRGQVSPELAFQVKLSESSQPGSIWSRHEQLVQVASTSQEVPTHGAVPNELKQYFDQPNTPRASDPIKFWIDCRNFTPVLSDVALKYLISPASSVSSERVASAVNLTVQDNRSRLSAEHIKERVFLTSISNKYWF